MRLKIYIFKELFYVRQGLRLFDVFYFNTFRNVSYFCDIKAQFSASRDPAQFICLFAAQETFLIIISVENSCAA